MDKLTWQERRLLKNLRRNVQRHSFSQLLSRAFSQFLVDTAKADFPQYQRFISRPLTTLKKRRRGSS